MAITWQSQLWCPLTHTLHGIVASVKLLCWLTFPAVRSRVGPVDDHCPPSIFPFTGISVFYAGICNGPQRGLSLSSEEMVPEACLENGKLVGDKVPVSLCLTALPCDENIWEMLSPKLSTGTAILGQDETRVCQSVQGTGPPAVCEGERYHLSHKNSLGLWG